MPNHIIMKKQLFISSVVITIIALTLSFVGVNIQGENSATNFTLMGANFNDTLPIQSTCLGIGIAPELFWAGIPKGTESYALTMHQELDNGCEKVYMVQYNIDGIMTSLKRGDSRTGTWGVNTINDLATYAAPCSIETEKQQYIITLYALSKTPNIRPSNQTVTKAELEFAISSIILAKATKTVVVTSDIIVYTGV